MKRIFLLIILTSFLFSKVPSSIVLKNKTKETNNTIIQKETIIKNWLIKKLNSFTPDFLNISPKDSIFKFKTYYDTKENKIKTSLNAKVILPAFKQTASKIKISKSNVKTKIYTFKLIPLLMIYKSILTPTLKTVMSLKNDYVIRYSQIAETIYYYFIHNEYKENTSFAINRIINIENIKFKISKTYLSTDKNNLYYMSGIYYYTKENKFIKTYGFEISGQRKKLPVIYMYKLFFDYRHTIFDKKFAFFDITPYLYSLKDYHYQIKPALNVSFNIKF